MTKKVLKEYDGVCLKESNLNGVVDFEDIFGRSGEVHIEIGCGKGTFLVSQARGREDVDFLGIEWANKYYRYAVDRIGRWGIGNVRIIRTDAADFICGHVGDETVGFYHVYFPDPWPKKRHHKRRFVCERNMVQLLRTLKSGGIINIATDHEEYFEQMEEVVAQVGDRAEVVDFVRSLGAEDGEVVGTNYERKYIKDKRAIHTIAVKKI